MVNGISGLTTPEAIWKTSVSALTLAIATYMGREASGHRKEARDAQLDLNALEPFLANMDEKTAHDLREQFAKQTFGRPLANSKDHGGFTWLPAKESAERRYPGNPRCDAVPLSRRLPRRSFDARDDVRCVLIVTASQAPNAL